MSISSVVSLVGENRRITESIILFTHLLKARTMLKVMLRAKKFSLFLILASPSEPTVG